MQMPSILAIVAAAASAVQTNDGNRSLSEAIDLAIDQCAASAFGSSATLDGRIAVFTYAEGRLASILESRGFDTTAQLPELIRRFAATSRYSGLFGSRDVVAIAGDEGVVWLVETADPQHCDIGITGIEDVPAIPAAITDAVMANEGWSLVDSADADWMWHGNFSFTGSSDTNEPQRAHISANVLVGEQAGPDGIQAEINFSAEEAADPAGGTL